MLKHRIEDRTFARQQVFDVTPPLERRERVHVLMEKILLL